MSELFQFLTKTSGSTAIISLPASRFEFLLHYFFLNPYNINNTYNTFSTDYISPYEYQISIYNSFVSI